jgi:hypothetical protein
MVCGFEKTKKVTKTSKSPLAMLIYLVAFRFSAFVSDAN